MLQEKRREMRDSQTSAATRALSLSMPLAVPNGTTFNDVLLIEYKNLERASNLARDIRKTWKKLQLHVTPNDPKCSYRRRMCEVRPQVHIGQLKLFLSELQFLTEFAKGDEKHVVVYAGAANGHHIPYLSHLFPMLEFHLYDPRDFYPGLHGLPNVTIFTEQKGLFSSVNAFIYSGEYYRSRGVLFISDIRTGNPDLPGCDFEECCARDMESQQEWVKIIKPIAAMLKFRLPYAPGKTKWLAPSSEKHLLYGVFATTNATEMRLISTEPYEMCEYDNTEMEERAYYFNSFTRCCQYGADIPGLAEHPGKKSLHMDDCWDCTAMRDICLAYLEKKCEPECPGSSEVIEVLSAAIANTTDFSKDICNIIARSATCIDEDELYGFIGAVIRNCGSNANQKMRREPHGVSAPGVQWIDRMHKFRGAHVRVKKGRKRLSPALVREINKLYETGGIYAPPIGVHIES